MLHETLRFVYGGRLRFESPADQGPVRHPRPEVGDPQVEPARDESGRKVPRPRPVARAIVVIDQLAGYETRIVVDHPPEVVPKPPPGDDGVVERVPEDRRAEEAVDDITQSPRGTVQGPVARRADEYELLE